VGPLVDAWGFGPSGPRSSPPSEDELQELRQRTGWQKLIADPEAGTLRKLDPRLQIDLGSFLQGYAADQLGKKLNEAGVAEYLIDVGGELLARGSWLVAVEDPLHGSAPLRTLRLENQALATSGVYRTAGADPGGGVHHLISPQSGRPIQATAILSAVVAPTAREADAWATVLLSVGLPSALQLADEEALGVLLIRPSGEGQTNSFGAQLFDAKE
jgi:thiamine biosynthesis lipoprotein